MGADQPAIANGDTLAAHYPQGTHWDIQIPHIDLARVIDEAIVKFSDRPATHFMGKTITYRELGNLISKATKGLQEMGVKPGDKVGLYMPNTPYYPIMFFAALKAGATVVNYSPLYTVEELRTQIRDSGTTTMVALDLVDFQKKTGALLDDGTLKNVVTCPMAHVLPTIKSLLFSIFKSEMVMCKTHDGKNTVFENLVRNDGYYKPVAVDPESLAVLQYTGGTTGVPKGAALTHFNLVSNAYQIQEFFMANPDKPDAPGLMKPGQERVLAAIPYFHVFGMMIAMISSLGMGAELNLIPNPKEIDTVLKTLDNRKPSLFPAVPRLLQAISENKRVNDHDLTRLRAVISGGAPLPGNVKDAFENAALNQGVIKQGYGLSETSPVVASNPPYGLNKPDTVGLAYPRTEIKIADPDDSGKIMKVGEIGEICIKGPQVMQGYYNRPDETAQVMKDGWFLTGDLGYLDEDMYLHIVDRKKRMLIVNGENVYPNQVEKVISTHPAVAECVVISLPDPRSGEVAKAFIRFKDGVPAPTVDEMRDFLSQSLNRLAVPRHIEYRKEELPKTAVGKPDWKRMQDEERAKIPGSTIPSEQSGQKPPASGDSTPATPKGPDCHLAP